VSHPDPFDDLNIVEPIVRRRDLREPSTRRSRKDARKRAEAVRKSPPTRVAPGGPRSRANTKPAKKSVGHRVARVLFSAVALLFAAGFLMVNGLGLLATSPNTAVASSTSKNHTADTAAGSQSLTAAGEDTPVSRDKFAATSTEAYGQIRDLAVSAGYTVDNSGVIRWPFNTAVPLGDPFGPRIAPCAGCSTFHNGTDFETGDKAPVYAVAVGTVTQAGDNGSLGESVSIDHVIKGKKFTSVYGHMTEGSLKVSVGEKITKGELVGLTGSTGESTGPHLFFEIDIADKPIDSFKWLKANTAH
jgi:murein DD-endopeptidase MepM/ murein hydrolase activator NlpD